MDSIVASPGGRNSRRPCEGSKDRRKRVGYGNPHRRGISNHMGRRVYAANGEVLDASRRNPDQETRSITVEWEVPGMTSGWQTKSYYRIWAQ